MELTIADRRTKSRKLRGRMELFSGLAEVLFLTALGCVVLTFRYSDIVAVVLTFVYTLASKANSAIIAELINFDRQLDIFASKTTAMREGATKLVDAVQDSNLAEGSSEQATFLTVMEATMKFLKIDCDTVNKQLDDHHLPSLLSVALEQIPCYSAICSA